MFLLYNLVLTILSPFWIAWMLFRTAQRKEKPIWGERFGNYPFEFRKDRKRIWIHAVSVGEVVATIPVLKQLKSLLPDYDLVLSVTTSSGHQTAIDRAKGLYDYLVYFPIDVTRFALVAMQRVQPAVVLTIDTELWRNFVFAAKAFRATTMLVNGRISDRSFPLAHFFRFFYRDLLKDVDICLMQTQVDADRITALGGHNVSLMGNVKFDQAVDGLDADPVEWREKLNLRTGLPVIVIGSTRGAEEEAFVLKGIRDYGFEKLAVIHAPRHLERVPDLVALATKEGAQVARRSKGETGNYIILDTYGELGQVYSVADIAIIGGGFAKLGGQNLMQPLAHGKPVIHGPFMHNFRDVAQLASEAGATRTVRTPAELTACLSELLEAPDLRQRMGEAATAIIAKNTGASERCARAIAEAAETSEARK
jgi:3-deoxy-D-manno-octulosonic-acid transferase